jgi:hypothetical protein
LPKAVVTAASGVFNILRWPKGWKFEPNKDDVDLQMDHKLVGQAKREDKQRSSSVIYTMRHSVLARVAICGNYA